MANGWPKKQAEVPPTPLPDSDSSDPTIQEWIQIARRKANVRPETVAKYEESLLTIAGEILGKRGARKKEEREKIANMKLSALPPPRIQEWIDSRLERTRGVNPVKANRAKNTIRTSIGNANGLFSKHIMESVEGNGTEPIRLFVGVKRPKKVITKYSSRFDATTLLKVATQELGVPPSDPLDQKSVSTYEQWKILYLALVAACDTTKSTSCG